MKKYKVLITGNLYFTTDSEDKAIKYAEENNVDVSQLEQVVEESKKQQVPLEEEEEVVSEETSEEIESDVDTQLKELAKKENQEVVDYIEMRSAEEVSNVLDSDNVLEKINNGESVNEKQADDFANKIYDLIDSENVEEGSVKESELYDVIEKVENYENKTKTVEKSTTETRLLTRFRKNAGQVSQKAFRDQVSGSEVDFKGNKGTVDVDGGNIVFKTEDGVKNLGNATEVLTQDFTTDNILKDENGNVTGVKMNTPEGEITINNPEVGLDLGIQLQEKIVGRHPLKDIEVAYEEVIKEEGIEVKVINPKVEKALKVKLRKKL